MAHKRQVAAFDFDGTISQRDTLGPFLASVCGRGAVYRALLVRSPVLGASLLGIGQRDAEKERLCGKLLSGRTIDSVRDAGDQYASRLVRDGAFRDKALDDLTRHRELGHEIVIVSASLDVYLDPLALHLGVDHVISTSLEVDERGHVTGRLLGANVRGPEKARRLRAWLGPEPVELWAYGDSAGDRELLAMADHPTRVR